MKVARFAKIDRPAQLRRAGYPSGLGRLARPARRQSGQFRHPHDRACSSLIFLILTLVVTPLSRLTGGAGLASSAGCWGFMRSFTPACIS